MDVELGKVRQFELDILGQFSTGLEAKLRLHFHQFCVGLAFADRPELLVHITAVLACTELRALITTRITFTIFFLALGLFTMAATIQLPHRLCQGFSPGLCVMLVQTVLTATPRTTVALARKALAIHLEASRFLAGADWLVVFSLVWGWWFCG